MTAKKYKDFIFPDEFGLISMADNALNGVYRAEDVQQIENGTYVHNIGIGSPLYLRITKIDGDKITAEDGGGDAHEYRIVDERHLPR